MDGLMVFQGPCKVKGNTLALSFKTPILHNVCNSNESPLGGIGRRKGLKIPRLYITVPVQVRERAPFFWKEIDFIYLFHDFANLSEDYNNVLILFNFANC